ncbi:FadR/GntR family transcriptional regulator [Albidovulum sediminis]|uniref:FadR family transcriptional regulator n=1 Tax=Albidovulum sediminis TaxID=3066345 RepID=A0ABT2NK95_9RHOB|nr:FadR/GntR family transcriptional regulator [Defluviimonas sediminis]MCT8329336.1 FadR family transcriptional regulator [Defluviimonas sediminis]
MRDQTSEVLDPVTRLRGFIKDGGYAGGGRLPPERHLSDQLGLSRATLRKALDALERDGVIWRHVGKGTFVADGTPPEPEQPGQMEGIVRQLTPFRMMRARLAIEPAIAREAAVNASGEALLRMRRAIDRAKAATTWKEYESQDDRFHRSIAEASDNLLLLALFDQLNEVRRAVAWGSVTRETERPSPDHTSFGEHDAIAEAIANRDPGAAYEAMRRHLGSVARRLFGEG